MNYTDSFRMIFNKSLKVTKSDRVTILVDNSIGFLKKHLFNSILDFNAIVVDFSHEQQLQYVNHVGNRKSLDLDFPSLLYLLCRESDVVLNMLNNSAETTPFRKKLIQECSTESVKFAHLPGISRKILNIIEKTDFDKIYYLSELMAWILGQSEAGKLATRDNNGNIYEIEFQLNSWKNEPLMSPGVIFKGTWGNIPPGETFCCPLEGTAHGEICINGSLPGIPLKFDEGIILKFKKGNLISWHSASKRCNNFFNTERMNAQIRNDQNWNKFAELGIGLNSAIHKLCGNPLFDEKMLRTVHIAIGNNDAFGKGIVSDYHHDMVTKRPDLFLDGVEIMKKGEILIDKIESLRTNFNPPINKFNPETNFSIDLSKFTFSEGKMQRKLSSAKRIGYVNIANHLDDSLCEKLRSHAASNPITNIRNILNIGKDSDERMRIQNTINLFMHYNIIEIK